MYFNRELVARNAPAQILQRLFLWEREREFIGANIKQVRIWQGQWKLHTAQETSLIDDAFCVIRLCCRVQLGLVAEYNSVLVPSTTGLFMNNPVASLPMTFNLISADVAERCKPNVPKKRRWRRWERRNRCEVSRPWWAFKYLCVYSKRLRTSFIRCNYLRNFYFCRRTKRKIRSEKRPWRWPWWRTWPWCHWFASVLATRWYISLWPLEPPPSTKGGERVDFDPGQVFLIN